MGWNEKIGDLDNLFLFCKDWKSRADIKEKFKLTEIESWHACKALSGYPYYIQREVDVGKTAKSHMFKTRYFELRNIKVKLEEGDKYECDECGFVNSKDKKCSNCQLTTN